MPLYIVRQGSEPSSALRITVRASDCGRRTLAERCAKAVSLAAESGGGSVCLSYPGNGDGCSPEEISEAARAIRSLPESDSVDVYLTVGDPAGLKLRAGLAEEVEKYLQANLIRAYAAPYAQAFNALPEDGRKVRKAGTLLRSGKKRTEKNAPPDGKRHVRSTAAGLRRDSEEAAAADELPVEKCEIAMCGAAVPASRRSPGFEPFLEDGFADTLMRLIDEKGVGDVACYKKANVSKQTWHKIMSDRSYRPSKKTVISFAIALELDYERTQRLLATAGFTLSKSSMFDVIIEYFIRSGNYDMFEIDETLFKYDQETLASVK